MKPKVWVHVSDLFQALLATLIIKEVKGDVLLTAEKKKSVIWAFHHTKFVKLPIEAEGPPWKSINTHVRLVRKLIPLVEREKPKIHIAFSSISSVRTAFGLSIPTVIFYMPNYSPRKLRMILPLAERIVVPHAIANRLSKEYNIPSKELITYNGIPELPIARSAGTPAVSRLDLSPEKFVVTFSPSTLKEAIKIPQSKQPIEEILIESNKHGLVARREGWLRKKYTYDIPSVIAQSDLVISSNPVIARISAAAGIPTIYNGPEDPLINYLKLQGLPLKTGIGNVDNKTLKDLYNLRVKAVKARENLEDPIRYIVRLAREYVDG